MSPTPLPTAAAAVKRAVEEGYTTTSLLVLRAGWAGVVLHCIPGAVCTGSFDYPVVVRENGGNGGSGSGIFFGIGLYAFFIFTIFFVGICGLACARVCEDQRDRTDDVEKGAPRAKPRRKRRNSDFVDAFLRGVAKPNDTGRGRI